MSDAHGVGVPVALRWADMDAYGHVNNTDVFRLLEQARIEGLPLIRDPETTGFLIVRHEIEYTSPIPYSSAGVVVQMWVVEVGAAAIELGYEVRAVPAAGGARHAWAASTLVAFDFPSQRPRRLTDEERGSLLPLQGPEVPFRRRR